MDAVPNRAGKHRGIENKDWIRAKMDHLRSNVAQPHKTPDQKGSRQANKQKAIKDHGD
jgi:hypothetical protein